MFSVLCVLAWGTFELGHADDTGAIEVTNTVLYCITSIVSTKTEKWGTTVLLWLSALVGIDENCSWKAANIIPTFIPLFPFQVLLQSSFLKNSGPPWVLLLCLDPLDSLETAYGKIKEA